MPRCPDSPMEVCDRSADRMVSSMFLVTDGEVTEVGVEIDTVSGVDTGADSGAAGISAGADICTAAD